VARQNILPHLLALLAAAAPALGQDPEGFFRDKGADFRGTAPETRLYWRSHVAHSHRRILEAAALAQGRRIAIVLGCGVGTEIPLAELARHFERLILVDLDGPSMIEALEQVPLELRPRVELRIMDVTSFASPLMERLTQAVDESSTAAEAFSRFGAIFGELRLHEPALLPLRPRAVLPAALGDPAAPAHLCRPPRARSLRRRAAGCVGRIRRGFQEAGEPRDRGPRPAAGRCLGAGGAVYYADTLARGPSYSRLSRETRARAEAAVIGDFRRLGLARSEADVAAAVSRLCVAERSIETEVEAYERLLAAYREASDDSFEPLLPSAELQRALAERGFTPQGAPDSWLWLSYPCAIATSPGAFRVQSLLLRRLPAR
jgi:hypothetical protein